MKYLMMLVISLGLVGCGSSSDSGDGTPPTNIEITTNSSLYINTSKTFVENITSNFDDHYAVAYSIDGGANSSDFTIDATDGNLSFNAPVVFNSIDSALNEYKVIIKAEGNTQSATKDFVVTVKNYVDFAVIEENNFALADAYKKNRIVDIDTGVIEFEFSKAVTEFPEWTGQGILVHVSESGSGTKLNEDTVTGGATRWSIAFASINPAAGIINNPQDGDVLAANIRFTATNIVSTPNGWCEYDMTITFCSTLAGTCP